MKLKWKILIGVGVFFVVSIAAVFFWIDGIVRKGIEVGATAVLGTETSLGGVDLGLIGGSAELSDLKIANPEGYGDGKLFQFKTARAALTPSSLLSDTIEIREIVIDGPTLFVVSKGLETNISAVMANLDASSDEQEASSGGGKQFRIGLIRITNARFEYSVGGAPAVKVPLPDIEIKDLSNEDGSPLMLADVISQVLSSMAASAAGSAAVDMPDAIGGSLKSIGAGGKAAVEETLGAASDAVKGVGGLLSGLTGKKDEEKEGEPSDE